MLTVRDFEQFAHANLPLGTREYYRNGAHEEETLRENESSFKKFIIRPRYFHKDVSIRDATGDFLGFKSTFPVAVAPTAFHRLAHPLGETATVQACEEEGVIYTLSSLATSSVEEVASASPKANKWFQLYVYKDRKVTEQLIQRVEKAGFTAIVWTVDTPFIGIRLGERRVNFHLPPHLKLANFEDTKPDETINVKLDNESALHKHTSNVFDGSLTWKDLKWLRSITSLPVIAKGVMTGEDAVLACEAGIDGIVVSNHGARQLDCVAATIEVLPEVVNAVQGRVPVYMDGGVRTGTDIFKALALGAKGVFLGRPILWGLTHSGKDGVRKVIQLLKEEFDVALALTGCPTLQDIKPSHVMRKELLAHLHQTQ